MKSHRRTIASFGAAMLALVAAVAVQAADRVYGAAEEVQPLATGARVPAAVVMTVKGEPVDLTQVVRDRGALLVFYRGGW